MGWPAEVRHGDVIPCERCGATHVVKSLEWEVVVQVVVCPFGIQLVGIEHEPIDQRTIVDYLAR